MKFYGDTKSISPDMAGWLRADDVDANDGGGAKLTSPYSQSSWVYIAISCLAENVAQIPLRISRIPQSAGKQLARGANPQFKKRVIGENIIESGEVVDLFNNPHPTMDRALFMSNIVSWKALRGEFFVVPLDAADSPVDLASRGGRVKRLLTLEPGLFWHKVQGYELQAWRYTGSPLLTPLPSEMLLPTEVIHHRTFNPFLYWRGLSPLILATLAAMSDYAASQFMKGLMMNNADTGVIITTDQQVQEAQREQILAALMARKRKAGTADRPLFLWGGAKMEKPQVSQADMEFLANRKYNREEIFAVFKVPPSMAGIETASGGKAGGASGSSSGGSQQQDRRVFIENTITNFCRQIEASFTPIVKLFDPSLEIWFDVDSLPIMQEARRDRLDAGGKAFAMGVPLNDINTAYDLGFPEYQWGDTGYLPFNLQGIAGDGLTEKPEPGNDPNNPQNPEDSPAEGQDPNAPEQNQISRAQNFLRKLITAPKAESGKRKAEIHQCAPNPAFEQSIAPSVKTKQTRMSRFFFEQRGRVLAKLAKETGKTLVQKSIDDLWDKNAEDAALLARLKAQIIADLEFGGAQIFDEIGAGDFSLPPAEALAYLAARKNAINGINATTWDELKASLGEGLKNGESYEAMADRVKAVYKDASMGRAETIALTETNAAVNAGRNNAMNTAGVTRKGWKTSHLENTRATHIANEVFSDENNGIPLDDTWPNGCDYPGDPDGDAGETINCRCFGYALQDSAGKTIMKAGTQEKFLNFAEWLKSASRTGQGGVK